MTGIVHPDKLARFAGAAIGLCLAAALIVIARPASGHGGVLPASLSISARQDGAVAITPAAPQTLLADPRMRPGSHASGRMQLVNQTGGRLAVGLRASPSSTALDGIARVRVTAGARTIADDTIQGLRRGSTGRIAIPPGGEVRLHVLAWIPAEIETGYEGRRVRVALAPVVGGSR